VWKCTQLEDTTAKIKGGGNERKRSMLTNADKENK
jgi:hypothetical protein